jgi:chromatin modification-related protein YNG2
MRSGCETQDVKASSVLASQKFTLIGTEIQQEINKETARYLKHSLAGKSTPKDSNVHSKVSADYTTLSELSEEKIALAQRLVTIISRARQRLNVDLGKVLVLQGDLDSSQLATYSSIDPPVTPPAGSLTSGLENMKIAIAPEPVFSQTVSTAPTHKRTSA